MLFDTQSNSEPITPSPVTGKDEMNFAEFPIALLTDRVPKGQKLIRFEDQIFDEKRKRLITRRRLIEGSKEYGLPTATDDLVILGLIQLTKLKGNFTKREVEFTRRELIKLLEWTDEGKNYERIKLSLLRIKAVNYIYDNAWWDSRQKMWTTKAFNIIDNVEVNDSRALDGRSGVVPSRIVWNEVVFDSFQAGFLRNIDFQLCMRLEHPIALRMYRFLGKRFYIRQEWIFDLKQFAYEHMALSRNYEGGMQIARKLKPAVNELETIGFLEPLPENERFTKNGHNWSIRFVQKTHGNPVLQKPIEDKVEPDRSSLVLALTSRGITAKTTTDIIRIHPAEYIQDKLDVFDWLIENQDKRISKSPEGYLVNSIRDDYKAPKGYVSKAERQRREEARKSKEREVAEERRLQQEQQAREKAERTAIEAYWKSLTPEQQAELDAASIAAADPKVLEIENSLFKQTGCMIRRHNYIRRLLADQKSSMLVET